MSHPIMYVIHSSITHERLDQISTKYHIVDEYGAALLGPTSVIDRPPARKVDFYLYYFEVAFVFPLLLSLVWSLISIESILVS